MMNQAIEVGPLTLAYDRLLAVVLIWVFLALGARWGRRSDRGEDRAGMEAAAWWAVVAGLLTARLAYVAQNSAAFGAEPWTIFAVWQGGFSIWWGVAAAMVVVVARSRSRIIAGPLLLLIAALSFGQFAVQNLVSPPPQYLPAKLIVMDMGGKPVALDAMRGQPFVVNLWASWCGPCRREMPMMKDVASKSAVPIFFANQGEGAQQVAAYLRSEGMGDHRIWLDPLSQLGGALGARALPTTIFVTANGQIVTQHVGEISRAALLNGMEQAAAHHNKADDAQRR